MSGMFDGCAKGCIIVFIVRVLIFLLANYTDIYALKIFCRMKKKEDELGLYCKWRAWCYVAPLFTLYRRRVLLLK